MYIVQLVESVETKIINQLRAGLIMTKRKLKITVYCTCHKSYSYCLSDASTCLCSLMTTSGQRMSQWMVSWGVSSQTWIRRSLSSWTVCDPAWQCQIHWHIMSHSGPIGLTLGGVRVCQCLHQPGPALTPWPHKPGTDCTRRNPGPTAPV